MSRSPRKGVTANVPTAVPIGPSAEDEGPGERIERPRRSAKSTTRATDYVYF